MNNDTICALATATGGALGIIRISGTMSFAIISKIFSKDITRELPNTIHYGYISNIDEVLVSIFKSPHSYTGEDSVEISCHGSQYIIEKVLELLVKNGCRMAEPGEFTMRAFLNGKMDLSQAEAVADLIASNNEATHRMAMTQLRGGISSELSILRDKLLRLTSLLELELDFSDHEDLEFANRRELLSLAKDIDNKVSSLANTFDMGQAIKKGIPVAIIGKTNVGKSTLLNTLLKDDRAIVSDIHGTTRDTIEDTMIINGITFRFIDTAGIRQTSDYVEQIGIDRTYQAIEKARIIVWLTDERPTQREISEMEELCYGKETIVVQNKLDINADRKPWTCPMIFISAKTGDGIQQLEQAIFSAAHLKKISDNEIIINNVRHYDALLKAHESLSRVIYSMNLNISTDLIVEDLRMVLNSLSEITGGQITTQEILNNIFSQFCVGK